MKREEEINIAAKNKYPYIKGLPQSSAHQAIFVEGAEWADKTMLDRACEWLENELKETDNKNGYPTVEGLYFVSVKEFINEFRQAMKGE